VLFRCDDLRRHSVYIDNGDRTRFAVDQPRTVLASFASQSMARVDLDRKPEQGEQGRLGTGL
jgi:hypothetical protein